MRLYPTVQCRSICAPERKRCLDTSEESAGRISERSGATVAGTLWWARLAGIATCSAFKNSLGCEQELRTYHGVRYAVHNQAHRIRIGDTIAVTVTKIVV